MRGAASALCLLLFLICVPAPPSARAGDVAYIAIILDDIGHNRTRGERAIRLPAPVTFSMLPWAQHSAALAQVAQQAGREVMVHLPMANIGGKGLGPRVLVPEMSEEEFIELVADAISKVPNARGVNNHMGSLLTARPLEMGWLMREIKQRELFFIDSRTTADSVASRLAREHQVFNSSRDVFLDNDRSIDAIEVAFERLIDMARARGTAIAIGHPHPTTLEYLERELPRLAARGIRVVPASHTIALQRILAKRPAASAATD